MTTDCKKTLYIAFLINFAILLYLSTDYTRYLEGITAWHDYLYYVLASISHFFILGVLPLLISLFIFFISKHKTSTYCIFACLSAFSIIMLKIDTTVYSQFRFHLSPIVFNMVFGPRASDIFHFSTSSIIKTSTIIALVFISQGLILKLAEKVQRRISSLKVKATSAVIFSAIFSTQIAFSWADANFYSPITQSINTFPIFHPMTAQSFYMKHDLVDQEKLRENRKLSKISGSKNIKYPLSEISATPLTKQKNILFLVIDSWRYDGLSEDMTPNMHSLSQSSQVFNNHFSGSNATSDGIFSLFYGVNALSWDAFTHYGKSPVFIDQLQQQNYELQLLGSANFENPPFDANVFSKIENLRLHSNATTPALRDIEITDEWLELMDKRSKDKPFFGFLFYDAAHGFDYPEDYPSVFQPALDEVDYTALDDNYEPREFYNRYKNSLHFIDSQIARVIDKLKQENLLESTIIVVTSDHGQEFNNNEKGYWLHGGNFSKHQIQVPLFIYDADLEAQSYNHLSLHYDITPTLMERALGVTTASSDYSNGWNIYNTENRDWFITAYKHNYAIIEKDRITRVNLQSGLFTIKDLNLELLPDAKLNHSIMPEVLQQINKFKQPQSQL